ncbi:MAG: hypothetical protein VKJ24_05410 [Synechococcales bacterium]|nr:hypothetical protein [Synechococcales bacterium]
MKSNLKRIEQTLRKLPPAAQSVPSEGTSVAEVPSSQRSLFFEVKPRKTPAADPAQAAAQSPTPATPASAPVMPFPVETSVEEPTLPRFKTPSFTSHRNGSNPALAANLLREMLTTVEDWQRELIQVGRQIQDLYLQGPIVDGWLESDGEAMTAEPTSETVLFRHADIDQLVKFAEKLISGEIQPERVAPEKTGYRLCGLNPDGRVWFCPCPPEQLPAVSLAIARHHQFRQLRIRQQTLETRLAKLSENLVRLHGQLNA